MLEERIGKTVGKILRRTETIVHEVLAQRWLMRKNCLSRNSIE
ncbi:MAG: hypothetical protein WC295_05100 [Methanoregula sp.]